MSVFSEARAGIIAILPAAVASIPFALLVGQQAVAKGMTPLEVLAMSSIVFAGSAQILAVSLWEYPVPVIALGLSALLINLRHVLLGASIASKFQRFGALEYPAAFLLTDEVWAIAERRALTTPLTASYWFGAGIFLYLNWQAASVFGAVFGSFIADPARYGIDFAFPAIFISLTAGFWKGWRTLTVIATAALVSIAVHRTFPGGWYVIAGSLAGILAAVLTEKPREEVPA